MNVALLFDASAPSLGPDYGYAVLRLVLGTGVMQSRQTHTRVSIGDILTWSHRSDPSYPQLLSRVYSPLRFDRLHRIRLRDAMADSTIFCWLLQAINDETADAMDHALKHTEGYLGATDVSFGDPVQLHFFRQLLPEFYRFRGSVASILYTGGSNPDPDIAEKEIIEDSGMSVRYEDIGARKTMFDQYTDLEYFQRIEYVLDVASGLEGISGETVSELALTLEEIHPHLFNILAAAMRAIHTSQTEEDLAQAALSGRRFLEALANYWFPAREGLINGRKVGLQQYRNRIWAYLTDAANSADPPAIDRVPALGARLEELVEDFNAGLHAKVERQRMERSFIGLLIWLDAVIRLNPDAAVRPYLAYEFQIMAYWEKLAKRNFG